jgi:omega-6 fatty acid desaturase (delta-12 desaturase)
VQGKKPLLTSQRSNLEIGGQAFNFRKYKATEMLKLTKEERSRFGQKLNVTAIALFLSVVILYLGLAFATIAMRGLASIVLAAGTGLAIGLLFIIGHDACHQSLTGSRALNGLFGRVAFLPSLHPFSLWEIGHNKTHHRFNNVRGRDYVWEPMSLADFAAASSLRKASYCMFRHPLGISLYYLPEIWAKKLMFPWRCVVGEISSVQIADTALVWAFF